MAFMEGFSHLGSLIVVDPRVDQALADELHEITAGLGAHTGISLTAAVLGTAGLVLRSLSEQHGGTAARCWEPPPPCFASAGTARIRWI